MLKKTEAFAVRTTLYSETSVILRAYTAEFGMQSYLIQGVRKAKASITMAMLSPLSLLQMEVYHKNNGGLQKVKEMRPVLAPHRSQSHPIAQLQASFASELILKTIGEEEPNPDLFEFLKEEWLLLESFPDDDWFGLRFALSLTYYLGFGIDWKAYEPTTCLDLREGSFIQEINLLPWAADAQTTADLNDLMQRKSPDRTHRKRILDALMELYHYHVPGFSSPKSAGMLDLFD